MMSRVFLRRKLEMQEAGDRGLVDEKFSLT